ncbi:MAG: hypothetical protein Q4D17_02730 [Planctomycetia bacterium]|nr:hypothetical protein [Planctomycetia bacterium]
MKTKSLLFFLMVLFTIPVFADIKESREKKPFIPASRNTAYAVASGLAVSNNSAFIPTSALVSMTDFNSDSQPPSALNIYKGDLAETMMDRVFTSKTLKMTGNWQTLSPANVGRNGIDGLYIRMDRRGNPKSLMVADAKMNTARLGQTADGKQMSQSWIKPRLKRTADAYLKLGADLENAKLRQVSRLPKTLAGNVTSVPIDERYSAMIWKTAKGYFYHIRGGQQAAPDTIRRQVHIVGQYLDGAASGKVPYRQRLFTYQAAEGKHVFSIKQLDAEGNVIRGATQKIQGTFNELPREYQRLIRHAAVQTLGQQKNIYGFRRSTEEVKAMAHKCCQNPEYFNRICMKPRLTPLGVQGIVTTAAVTALMPAVDIALQFAMTGRADWQRAGTLTLLGGTSTAVGVAASTGLQKLIGCSSGFSNFMGGSITGALFSIGMAAMGYCSPQEAAFNTATAMTAAGLTAATPVVMMAIATTFGTTASGTAISSLSGAAAVNAALAWWGGGSLAAGGAGMAGGSAMIAGVATGVGAAVVAVIVAYEGWKYFADVKHQHEFLGHKMKIQRERIERKIRQKAIMLNSGTN